MSAQVANPESETLVRPLGIGLPYFASLPATFYEPGLLDFVELTPETLCQARRDGPRTAIELVPEQVDQAQETCAALPMVVHGVELSIGSAQGWNDAYLELLDELQARWPFVWHSEHLSFQTIPGEDGEALPVGVPLPLPPTRESVQVVAERTRAIRERYPVPFALENPVHYLPELPSDPEIGDESGLMRAITERGDCFALLDLHNVYCNALNHKIDPLAIIQGMPLERVIEIHLAGGCWRDGFWTDAHDRPVPEPVWELLEYTLPRAPNVAGIVFEMLEEPAIKPGPVAITGELLRARNIWYRSRRL